MPAPASQPRTRPVIRRAVRADDTALAELDRRTWSPLHSVQEGPPLEGEPFFDMTHSPDHILIAECPAPAPAPARARASAPAPAPASAPAPSNEPLRIAGYVRVVPPTPLPANAHVRQIQGLAVDVWARGLGVARALLDAAGQEALRQGATRLTLRVLGHNAPARRLYESAGFAVEGVLPGEFLIEGEYVDDVLMGRSLPR
ncbi:GNAT family N-acetyltransferase [Streptomyces pathocidini]|uniref:GNAT family N-acetyltransferase n=1 Tax=Streptomyces pathocidini TaxID=1650571 RepID=A0ABW7US53_9ACTN|nr:GNAT family N-acetyltransferase [Streptomyces pathocidini]